MTRTTVTSVGVGDLSVLVPSFLRFLRAENKSPKTVKTYSEAATQFLNFLAEQGMPTDAAKVRREHVETFMEHLLARWKPATANYRYRALARLFSYLVDEGDIADTPMAKMSRPRCPRSWCPSFPSMI